jgi:hypothetical protein
MKERDERMKKGARTGGGRMREAPMGGANASVEACMAGGGARTYGREGRTPSGRRRHARLERGTHVWREGAHVFEGGGGVHLTRGGHK